ncbi:hypothetical protein [Sinomonas halotolerans]|uniref:DUF4190 domain-containing protein n=1 Tax=Sinomonas halotolerans TaxID=1644133 RepID=A0ABU9WY24_9MICC
MSTPGPAPRRNPYRDPSAYWPDGVPPGGTGAPRGGELVRGPGIPSSSAPQPRPVPDAGRSTAEPRGLRPRRPASRLATVLGGAALGFGLMSVTLGLVPWIGALLAALPLAFSVLSAWGSFARSRMRAARVSAMAVAGAALSVLHVVTLFVR